jgi:cobalamin synthase
MNKTDKYNFEGQVENAHFLSHMGKLRWLSDSNTGVTSVVYLIETGPKELHVVMRFAISTGGNVVITEAVTATRGGVILNTSYNRAEPRDQEFKAVISKTPTGVSGGTALPPFYVPVDNKGQQQTSVRLGAEDILAPQTKYLMTVTLPSGNVLLDMDMYEAPI